MIRRVVLLSWQRIFDRWRVNWRGFVDRVERDDRSIDGTVSGLASREVANVGIDSIALPITWDIDG